jgi:DNA-binding NtrC family response regulator
MAMEVEGHAVDPVETSHPVEVRTGPTALGPEFERFLRHAERVESKRPLTLRSWLDLAEAWRITAALRACRGNRSAAARALGIGRRTLYAKMDKLGITPTWNVGGSNGGE